MNKRALTAIISKDLKVITQNKGVVLPLIIVPLVMLVLLPGMASLSPILLPEISVSSMSELEMLVTRMPPGLQAELSAYTPQELVIVFSVVYLFAPLYLVIPLMVASVIAADSFAGEKERKTLEALLYTPTSDRELFLAKVLAAWLPATAVSLLGFVAYSLVANLAAWPVMGRLFFPNAMWLLLVFLVAPAVAGLGLGTMVLVSARAEGFQDAYQLGTIVVLPLVILLVAQAVGALYFSPLLVLLLGLVIWLLDAILIWAGSRTFQRSALISRL
jgi:ABC-type transport system involved in multi-copper enzyme maturation permease subunit